MYGPTDPTLYLLSYLSLLQPVTVPEFSLPFLTLKLFKILVSYFGVYPSIWICVMFSHFQIHIMDFWQEHLRGDMVI